MSEKTIRCVVHGRVQGVWFRGSTQDKARELGVAGWASNRDDGTVEVLAHGPAGAVDALHEWLHRGPRLAQVEKVVTEDVALAAGEIPPGFSVR